MSLLRDVWQLRDASSTSETLDRDLCMDFRSPVPPPCPAGHSWAPCDTKTTPRTSCPALCSAAATLGCAARTPAERPPPAPPTPPSPPARMSARPSRSGGRISLLSPRSRIPDIPRRRWCDERGALCPVQRWTWGCRVGPVRRREWQLPGPLRRNRTVPQRRRSPDRPRRPSLPPPLPYIAPISPGISQNFLRYAEPWAITSRESRIRFCRPSA
mmetsp:Transcript_37965/g.88339  ORF Transcript_37965/g.88339 Transcript_37965/m.88339 type:complete len:214 (-) Transcript_37965:9-650(-)